MVSTVARRRTRVTALALSALILAGPLAREHADAASAGAVRMKELINSTRKVYQRLGLRLNDRLCKVAQRHSARMASADDLYHNPSLAKDVGDMPWRILGENVGVGRSVTSLHTAFMNSPPHRRNILDRRFRRVGVGVVVAGGKTWVTVVFYG